MFQLIVAVISVALVAALAVALFYYGGTAFSTGQDKAHYAQYLNHGTQIEGALKLYLTEKGSDIQGDPSQIVSMLAKGDDQYTYLNSSPQGTWYVQDGTIYRSLADGECKRMNVVAKGQDAVDALGGDGCPSCTNSSYSDWPGCRKESMETVQTGQ